VDAVDITRGENLGRRPKEDRYKHLDRLSLRRLNEVEIENDNEIERMVFNDKE